MKPIIATVKRKRKPSDDEEDLLKHSTWREALGPPPPYGVTKVRHIKLT